MARISNTVQGRIYTRNFNRVEEGNNEDANRLFFPPKFYGEDGVVMGECEFFLTREDNSELEMVRELISGDKDWVRIHNLFRSWNKITFDYILYVVILYLLHSIYTNWPRRQSCLNFGCSKSAIKVHGNIALRLAAAESKARFRSRLISKYRNYWNEKH